VQEDRFGMEYQIFSMSLGEIAAFGTGVVVAYDYSASAKAALPTSVIRRINDLQD
jgi:hypothetical protein